MKLVLDRVTTIPAGEVLGLSQAQADSRSHALEIGKKRGQFLVRSPVQFKAGEEIDIINELPKGILPQLDNADVVEQINDEGVGET